METSLEWGRFNILIPFVPHLYGCTLKIFNELKVLYMTVIIFLNICTSVCLLFYYYVICSVLVFNMAVIPYTLLGYCSIRIV